MYYLIFQVPGESIWRTNCKHINHEMLEHAQDNLETALQSSTQFKIVDEIEYRNLPVLCFSCGEPIIGRGKTTEKGEHICNDCDRFYAYGGPGEFDV